MTKTNNTNWMRLIDPNVPAEHTQGFLDEYKPVGPVEEHFVRELANAAWRMRQILPIETALMPPSPATLESLSEQIPALTALGKYEDRLHDRFYNALSQLRKLQDLRHRTTRAPRRNHVQ